MLKDALGNYRGSLEELDRKIEKDRNNAEAYYDRANARFCAGDREGAVSDYTRAMELGLRPRENFLAIGSRGAARVELEDIDGAMDDFTAIIKACPKNRGILKTALFNRSLLKRIRGDYKGADQDYRHALSIKNHNKQ